MTHSIVTWNINSVRLRLPMVLDFLAKYQPDVLMLHHLVPGEVEPGSLVPNLDFYLPRTAHGSSLSPAVTATLLARAGRPDDALAMLDIALRLDLEDTTGMTAGGTKE